MAAQEWKEWQDEEMEGRERPRKRKRRMMHKKREEIKVERRVGRWQGCVKRAVTQPGIQQ